MPLVDTKAMLLHAYDSGYAVGAFDVVSLDSAVSAINPGCNGVMVDAFREPVTGNIDCTRAVVNMANACGVPVEGEPGYVPGVEGEDAARHPVKITYTTVTDATSYFEQTGVDFLAVSIGTVHGRMKSKHELDFQRPQQINENTRTAPSSGFTDLVKNVRTVVAADAERCTLLADKPTQAGPQGHYPLGLRWSTDNAFVKIHVRHREAA